MNRALTISLLFFFLADAVGCMLYLFIDWYEVKKEMTHLLASGELESRAITLTLDETEFGKITWIEANKEFIYNDKLYDMTSLKKLPNNVVKIRCIEDQREAAVFQHMGQLVDQSQSDPTHQRTFILSVFKFLSGLVFQSVSFPLHDYCLSAPSGDAYCNHYYFSFNFIPIQPPDHVSFSI